MKKRNKISLWALFVLIAAVMVAVAGIPRVHSVKLVQGEKPTSNPLKGWVAWGENHTIDDVCSLVYVPIYWCDIEPKEGVFDFDTFENKYNFETWRQQGRHIILRLVLDSPTEEAECKLPDWLYDKIDGDGTWYDCSYGKGFSPDYENTVLQEEHHKLLKALGYRYNNDPQIFAVQLGSIGHWGEWHVKESAGIKQFPSSEVTDIYVRDYLEAFPDKKLMMRRPFAVVKENDMGLFNDSFGYREADENWLDWVANGYVSDLNEEQLPDAKDFWKKAPSGGEIASNETKEWYFTDGFDDVMWTLTNSHTSFLGPSMPHEDSVSKDAWNNALVCQREMGYCFHIAKASLNSYLLWDNKLIVDIKNIGIAPFYEDWNLRVVLKDAGGNVIWSDDFNTNITKCINEYTFDAVLIGTKEIEKDIDSVWIGLVDPMSGECSVNFATEAVQEQGMIRLLKK